MYTRNSISPISCHVVYDSHFCNYYRFVQIIVINLRSCLYFSSSSSWNPSHLINTDCPPPPANSCRVDTFDLSQTLKLKQVAKIGEYILKKSLLFWSCCVYNCICVFFVNVSVTTVWQMIRASIMSFITVPNGKHFWIQCWLSSILSSFSNGVSRNTKLCTFAVDLKAKLVNIWAFNLVLHQFTIFVRIQLIFQDDFSQTFYKYISYLHI